MSASQFNWLRPSNRFVGGAESATAEGDQNAMNPIKSMGRLDETSTPLEPSTPDILISDQHAMKAIVSTGQPEPPPIPQSPAPDKPEAAMPKANQNAMKPITSMGQLEESSAPLEPSTPDTLESNQNVIKAIVSPGDSAPSPIPHSPTSDKPIPEAAIPSADQDVKSIGQLQEESSAPLEPLMTKAIDPPSQPEPSPTPQPSEQPTPGAAMTRTDKDASRPMDRPEGSSSLQTDQTLKADVPPGQPEQPDQTLKADVPPGQPEQPDQTLKADVPPGQPEQPAFDNLTATLDDQPVVQQASVKPAIKKSARFEQAPSPVVEQSTLDGPVANDRLEGNEQPTSQSRRRAGIRRRVSFQRDAFRHDDVDLVETSPFDDMPYLQGAQRSERHPSTYLSEPPPSLVEGQDMNSTALVATSVGLSTIFLLSLLL